MHMIQSRNYLIIGTALLLLSGCAATIPKPEKIQTSGINSLITTADHQVAYLKTLGDLQRMCGARPTDSVATDNSGVTLGFSQLSQTESIGTSSGRGELALGGRSPAVLITRELLYRACELTNNLNMNEKTSIDVYKMFLESLQIITLQHYNPGTQPISASLSLPTPTPTLLATPAKKDDASTDDTSTDDASTDDTSTDDALDDAPDDY